MGPLSGIKMIEIVGIGPCPFAAMMLSDLGAEILRVDRAGAKAFAYADPKMDFLARGRKSIEVDLKSESGRGLLLELVERSDVLLEGFRPGVMERLGVGPEPCLERNPGLVYGRMTGWGQAGPMAKTPGHDINYIALAGVLGAVGRAGAPPTPPLNLVGDFGGGGMLLAYGVLAALLERGRSGLGQVVDAAMVDGAALLMAPLYGAEAVGGWGPRGTNLLDSGAPFYDAYETADGEWISIGSLEPQFFAELLKKLDLDAGDRPHQMDPSGWPALRDELTATFRSKTRAEWEAILGDAEVCFAPVLSMREAIDHPHNRERRTFVEVDELAQPAPAPRFSRTPPDLPESAVAPGEGGIEALESWGFDAEAIAGFRESGALG
ncbi:MAG: CaiB/BaiF CoA-transferase family protein [Myxococcota bacterium]|nr:CaiB/BaiF CoA-transferase family protein [Myxococcota bacterium]